MMFMKLEINLIFNIAFLAALLLGLIFARKFVVRHMPLIFWMGVLVNFGIAFFYTHLQFVAWHNGGPPVAYLVPPHASIGYFLFYSLTRFWAALLVGLFFGILALIGAKALNKAHGERFFYPEEPWLIALAITIVGHPMWVFYLITTLFLYLVVNAALNIKSRGKSRISFYYFWIPVALALLISLPALKSIPLFSALVFSML